MNYEINILQEVSGRYCSFVCSRGAKKDFFGDDLTPEALKVPYEHAQSEAH